MKLLPSYPELTVVELQKVNECPIVTTNAHVNQEDMHVCRNIAKHGLRDSSVYVRYKLWYPSQTIEDYQSKGMLWCPAGNTSK